MNQLTALQNLKQLNCDVFQTQDVAALLNITTANASQLLGRLYTHRAVLRLRQGLWYLPDTLSSFDIGCYTTFPNPAYISLQSALNHHGLIEQIPGKTYVVSLTASKQITTANETFSIHTVHPTFFCGFEPHGKRHAMLATPEKALIDFFYVSATRDKQFKALPELHLDRTFNFTKAERYIQKIGSQRMKTIVSNRLAATSNP